MVIEEVLDWLLMGCDDKSLLRFEKTRELWRPMSLLKSGTLLTIAPDNSRVAMRLISLTQSQEFHTREA